jgi:hypothetical protein
MEENFAGLLAVGQGMPSGKFLFLGSSKTRNQKNEWRPNTLTRVPPKGSDAFFYWADEIQ